MTFSPYPVPPSRFQKILMVLTWAFGGLAAPWILTFPPITYQGLGLFASIGWGVMVGAGSLLISAGYLFEEYRIELPGVGLVVGGLAVYVLLSWQSTLTGSTGSGARAIILVLFLGTMTVRGLKLLGHHQVVRNLQRIARGRTE